MSLRWSVASLVLVVACGQGSVQVPPSPNPESAVETFMQSVADSNLTMMSQYWGTARGSAAETNAPADYHKRIEVMRAYLLHNSFRITSNRPNPTGNDVRDLMVDIVRDSCVRQVSFQVVRTRSKRWIIRNIDLAALGSPSAPCRQ